MHKTTVEAIVPVEKQKNALPSHVRITEQIEERRLSRIRHSILAIIIKKRVQSLARHIYAVFQRSTLQQIFRFLETAFR